MTITTRQRLRRRRQRMARFPHAWQYLLGMVTAGLITWFAVRS